MALRAIVYFIVKNPNSYQKLIAEINEQERQGHLSEFVNFQEGLEMKYLSVHPVIASVASHRRPRLNPIPAKQ